MPEDHAVQLDPATSPQRPKRRWSSPIVIRSEIEDTEKLAHLSEITIPIIQTGAS